MHNAFVWHQMMQLWVIQTKHKTQCRSNGLGDPVSMKGWCILVEDGLP